MRYKLELTNIRRNRSTEWLSISIKNLDCGEGALFLNTPCGVNMSIHPESHIQILTKAHFCGCCRRPDEQASKFVDDSELGVIVCNDDRFIEFYQSGKGFLRITDKGAVICQPTPGSPPVFMNVHVSFLEDNIDDLKREVKQAND